MQRFLLGVLFLNALATAAFAQPRLGAGFEDHHDPYGACVVKVEDGYPCKRIQSDEDGRQYYLSPNLHVITEINEVRVGNAAECVKAIAASAQRMTFRVYNIESGTHRKYHVLLVGEPQGELALGRSLSWVAGEPDPKFKHVLSAAEENQWAPAPGYTWVEPNTFGPVKWSPGSTHPDYHIIATPKEGTWIPLPGHDWISNSPIDHRVRWTPGIEHPRFHLVARSGHGNWRPADGYEWLSNDPNDLRVTQSTYDDQIVGVRMNGGNENFGFDLRALEHNIHAWQVMVNNNSHYYRSR